jgi:hypothetical protein
MKTIFVFVPTQRTQLRAAFRAFHHHPKFIQSINQGNIIFFFHDQLPDTVCPVPGDTSNPNDVGRFTS